MPRDDEMMTPEEVADWLKVSYATALRLIKSGDLPAIRVGRQYRVPQGALLDMVKRQGEGSGDDTPDSN